MNLHNVKLILLREIRDQLRDRRTLFMIFVLPLLLYPLLGMSLSQLVQFRRSQPTEVLVIGMPAAGAGPSLFRNGAVDPQFLPETQLHRDFRPLVLKTLPHGGATEEGRQEAFRAVEAGKYDVALYFPPDFADRLAAFRRAVDRGAREATAPAVPAAEIIYTTANERSYSAHNRLDAALQRWREESGKSNLLAGGVPLAAARPFELQSTDVAEDTAYHKAALWSKILPVMLLIWAMTGAFYPAVDLCAGEKERGTLETLLSSPAERSEIVLGKLLTVMVFSMATAVLNLVSMGVAGWLILGHSPEFGPPPPLAPLWLALALVPIAALYSALCLALAALARSTREGQYYLVPLLLVTMPLAVVPMTPGVELTLGNSLIPVTGLVLLLRDTIEGSYWRALQYLPVVLGVTLAACVLAVRWAVDQFNSESVLFREGERLDVGLWFRHLLRDRQPTPAAAAAVFCGILILMIHFFMEAAAVEPHSFADFARQTAIFQLAAIATPALLMAIMLTSSSRQTLLLRLPRWSVIAAAVVLAMALHPVVNALQAGVFRLYPLGPEVQDALEKTAGLMAAAPLWQVLLLLALVPALCEELAFRGFILSGFRHLGHRWRAIAFSALFFGLAHGILQQSLLACLLGVVLGLLAVQTGSLLPCVLFHLVHNALPLLVNHGASLWLDRWPALRTCVAVDPQRGVSYSWPLIVASGVAAAVVLAWFLRLPSPKSPEEELEAAIHRGSHNPEPEP
jgi:sodium transport system permease protein